MQRVLIVMRLVDMIKVHPRQDNSHVCSKCRGIVGLYPSGQAVLRRYPDTVIVCNKCMSLDEVKNAKLAPGAREEREESLPKI